MFLSDDALGKPSKLIWLTFRPTPTTDKTVFCPEKEFSISIPAIFFPSDKMSFGHLMLIFGISKYSKAVTIAVLTAIFKSKTKALLIGLFFIKILKIRFLKGSEIHLFPLCPLP